MSPRLSKMGAAILIASAAVSMSPTAGAIARSQSAVVTAPAQQQQQQQQQRAVGSQQVSARDEMERIREATALLPMRFRQRWDGKNRTAGDRAHKRMKHRRASGRR